MRWNIFVLSSTLSPDRSSNLQYDTSLFLMQQQWHTCMSSPCCACLNRRSCHFNNDHSSAFPLSLLDTQILSLLLSTLSFFIHWHTKKLQHGTSTRVFLILSEILWWISLHDVEPQLPGCKETDGVPVPVPLESAPTRTNHICVCPVWVNWAFERSGPVPTSTLDVVLVTLRHTRLTSTIYYINVKYGCVGPNAKREQISSSEEKAKTRNLFAFDTFINESTTGNWQVVYPSSIPSFCIHMIAK